jgi:SAM-dependent methyltransferase
MTVNFRTQLKVWAAAFIRHPEQFLQKRERFECSCCGYFGYFATARRKVPVPFRCPNCESKPRDRQIALEQNKRQINMKGKVILHFAPEWPFFMKLKNEPGYVGGDIIRRRNANAVVDITNIQFAEEHFDLLICNHVLEHVVDDAKAIAECFRVLKKGGIAIFSVPLSENDETWEPPIGMSQADIEKICGWDHKRLYGQDFESKLNAAGFSTSWFEPTEHEVKRYCLRNERIFVAQKHPCRS